MEVNFKNEYRIKGNAVRFFFYRVHHLFMKGSNEKILENSFNSLLSLNMDFTAFVKKLHKATTGLFFVSESEYPVEVIEPEKNITATSFVSALPKPVNSLGAKDFFESYIRNMKTGGDNAAAEKYENLYALVTAHANNVMVLRSGRIKIGIYILITADNQLVVLKTQAIET